MSDDTPQQSPEAVAVREEVRTIQTDPSHKLHAAFKANTAEYNAHVDGLYKKLPGADKKVELGGDAKIVETDVSVRQQPTTDEARKYQAAFVQTEKVLRGEWKDQYDANMTAVMETAAELFGGSPEKQRMAEHFFMASGGDPLEANRLLHKVSQWRAAAGKGQSSG